MIPSSDWCKNYDTFIWLHPARVPTSSHLEVQCSWVRRAPSPVVTSHCLHHSPSVEFHVAFTLYVMKTIPKSSPFCCGCKKKNIPSHGSFMALGCPSCSSRLARQRGVPIQSHPRLASSPSEKHRCFFQWEISCSSIFLHLWLKICQRNSPHTQIWVFKIAAKIAIQNPPGPFFLDFPTRTSIFRAGMFHVGHYRMSFIPRSRKSSRKALKPSWENLDTQLVNQECTRLNKIGM